jgi:pyruvate dehydrogenase E1 component beta subunit
VAFGCTRGLIDEFGPARVLNAPISEAAFADFVTCAMDEVANQIAKSRYMFGGQVDCPLTLRMPYGIGRSGGGHHSNSVEAWFVNIPGLLKTAIRDPDPACPARCRTVTRSCPSAKRTSSGRAAT